MKKKKTRPASKTKVLAEPRYLRCKLEYEDLLMNAKRAMWARAVLYHLEELVGTAREDAVADLLQYMMHLCDRDAEYGDFDEAMERAISSYSRFTSP